jgi:hypothetical protein
LIFIYEPDENKFTIAIEFLKDLLGENYIEQLDAVKADAGDKQEMDKVYIIFLFSH